MPSTTQGQSTASNERKKVGMLLPPPVLLLATIVLGAVFHFLLLGPFTFTPMRSVLGGALVVLSVLTIGACIRRFKTAGTPFRPVSPATAIVSSGLYRVSRNPMYVGMAGILLGLSLLLGSYVLALALLPFVVIVHFGVVLPEERYLEALHGEPYRQYKQSARRWL
jgi:protein-S-isoprenylcysteine O-methyltransferase Ste14